jgi:ABC-type glutathione transport system ATPase component
MTEQHAIPVDQLSRLPVPSSKMSPDVAIRTEALVRDFEGVRAVDGVDLQIPAGEIYGFLGSNGAGKSTTVHMLCTLLAPSGGRALVAGYDVADQPGEVRLRIGVALQEAALDPKQTGADVLQRFCGKPCDRCSGRRSLHQGSFQLTSTSVFSVEGSEKALGPGTQGAGGLGGDTGATGQFL